MVCRSLKVASVMAHAVFAAALLIPPGALAQTPTQAPAQTSTQAPATRGFGPDRTIRPPANAAISPDGLRAAWAADRDHSIVSATRAPGGEWSAPNRLLTTRGVVQAMVFSPDGKSIAYENRRTWKDDNTANDTWQFICVYDIATRQISYVDPSFDVDADPQWSPDGSQITFTRKVEGLPDAHLTRPVTRLQLGAYTPPPKRPSERFTMASIIAAQFIYPPAPSGDGKGLAYITREAKVRNVYYLPLGGSARRIASYPGDEGQDMSDAPAVSRTGAAVAYVHGGRINRQGDAPNPTSFPDMPQQQVWIVGTVNDAPRFLGPGRDPMFTPDDRYVLWRAGGKVMGASLTWRKGRLFGVGSPEEFLTGSRAGLRFSPDGGKAAYEQGDGVEVYDFATRTAVVIPHGADVDRGPIWSPDGASLIFRRESGRSSGQPRNACGRERYCGPLTADQPWSIWTVHLSDLKPRMLWQGHAGQGSVFYALDQTLSPGQHGDQMFWTANDRIVFPWEGDGWRHLYSIPAAGGAATLLTPGDGEVETAALTADRTHIVYATNIGELGRRHIWTVGFDSAPPRALTGGEKDQWSPVPLSGGKIAYINAGWADPPHVIVQDSKGKMLAARFPQTPAKFPASLLVKPQLVSFPATDGQTAYGQLFVPAKTNGCAIIFSHGGMRRQMLPGFHYMDAYQYLYEMNQYLASRGCVVLSVDYRSGIMYGLDFRNAPGFGYAGNSELRDFVGAAKYLLARKDVDAGRGVGVYGLSWGGYMTSELLAQHSDLFKAGFDMAGVHYAGDAEGEKYSAIGNIASWTSPVFLAQGDDDMNVDFNQGTTLARTLQVKRPNVELKQQVLPGQTHDLYLTYEQLVAIYDEGSNWLLDHMGVK